MAKTWREKIFVGKLLENFRNETSSGNLKKIGEWENFPKIEGTE